MMPAVLHGLRCAVLALGWLAACGVPMPVSAQQPPASQPAGQAASQPVDGPDLVSERARIKAERDRISAAKAQEERACQDRFAVNDCMNAAERRWRAPLADLRRQENAIRDVERRRRSAEQVRQAEARAAQDQADAAQRREKALQDQQDREARAAGKAGGPQPTGSPRAAASQPKAPSGPTPEQAAANASEHARRLQEAQERKRKAQERAAQEAAKGKARPLPPP